MNRLTQFAWGVVALILLVVVLAVDPEALDE